MTVKEMISRFLGLSAPAADATENGSPVGDVAETRTEGAAGSDSAAPETDAGTDAVASPDTDGASTSTDESLT